MVEMDTNRRYPKLGDVAKGDIFVEIDGKQKKFMKKTEYEEYEKSLEPAKIKYQKGVTKALREKAESFNIEVTEKTSKEELEKAIDEAELAALIAKAVELEVEDTENLSREQLEAAIKEKEDNA
jgi:hypothetical protein